MKRVLISCIILLLSLTALAQGLPFMRHFNTDDYKAHAMNFDLDIDKNGIVYVCRLLLSRNTRHFGQYCTCFTSISFSALKTPLTGYSTKKCPA